MPNFTYNSVVDIAVDDELHGKIDYDDPIVAEIYDTAYYAVCDYAGFDLSDNQYYMPETDKLLGAYRIARNITRDAYLNLEKVA